MPDVASMIAAWTSTCTCSIGCLPAPLKALLAGVLHCLLHRSDAVCTAVTGGRSDLPRQENNHIQSHNSFKTIKLVCSLKHAFFAAAETGNLDDILDELDAAAEAAAGAARIASHSGPTAAAAGAGSGRYVMQPYRPPKPQEPIQPGSSQVLAGSTARFLAYNQLGCVVSKEVDDHHVIEVGGLPGDRQDRGAGKGVQVLLGPAARAGCICTEPHLLLSLSDDLSRIQLLPSRKKYV